MTPSDVFIKDVRRIARANDITIRLPKTDVVYYEDDPNPCSGFFHSDDRLLVVGTGTTQSRWLSIMVHESCHMDQFIEDQFLWEKCSPAYNIFFDWLVDDMSVVKREVLEEAVQDIIRLELDCERRSIRKIKQYDLQLDIPYYIKGVNIYMYSYLYMLDIKKWMPKIYDNRDARRVASSRLSTSYTKIPRRLLRVFDSIYG